MNIEKLIGEQVFYELVNSSSKFSKTLLNLPGPDFVKNIFDASDRSESVKNNLSTLFSNGNLANTGYLSILPVDHGIEHSTAKSFSNNPSYFDPKNVVELALRSGCNAVVSSLGLLGIVSKKYAHQIPFIVKINHNDSLSAGYIQSAYASVEQAKNLGAIGIAATLYFSSPDYDKKVEVISKLFQEAHSQGMFTILWAYIRNGERSSSSMEETSQANYLAASLGADLIKQKFPTSSFENLSKIDMVRYQVLNSFAGRIGLLNSGGESGYDDLKELLISAIINKRAGGMGIMAGRKILKKDMEEGIESLKAVQNIYLDKQIGYA